MQIDDLLHKIDEKDGEVARVVEEKEQELLIMQEGMDSTLKELSEMRIVREMIQHQLNSSDIGRHQSSLRRPSRHFDLRSPEGVECHHRLDPASLRAEG